jgi:hypothetical protein
MPGMNKAHQFRRLKSSTSCFLPYHLKGILYWSKVKIHLEPDEAEAVRQIARLKGISYVELIKEWVLEKIHVK